MAEHGPHSSWVIVLYHTQSPQFQLHELLCGNNICKCAMFTLHHNPIIHRSRALYFYCQKQPFTNICHLVQ